MYGTLKRNAILPLRPTKCVHHEIESSSLDRRRVLRDFVAPSITVASGVVDLPLEAVAAFGSAAAPSRQLEFCLVSVARAIYWAKLLVQNLEQQENDPSLAKAAYLEARLGAKAMLKGKIGGGANARVYMLSTLQMPGCLQDLQTYYSQGSSSSSSKNNMLYSFSDLKSDWYEAVAAMVEFDGLDTLTDPSPRSSLTLQQYDPSKAVFVRRILTEKVIPVGQRLLQAFPDDARQRAKEYIERTYSSEVVGDSVL